MRDWQDHSSITCRVTPSRIPRLRPQRLLDLLHLTGSWVALNNHPRANSRSRLPRIVIHSVWTMFIKLGRVNHNPACRALSTLTMKMITLLPRYIAYLPSPPAPTVHRVTGRRTHLYRLLVRRVRDFRPWVCLLSPVPCPASIIMRQTSQLQSWQGRPLFPVNKATFLLADMEPRPMVLVCLVSILLTGLQITPVMFPQWHHWVIDQEPYIQATTLPCRPGVLTAIPIQLLRRRRSLPVVICPILST